MICLWHKARILGLVSPPEARERQYTQGTPPAKVLLASRRICIPVTPQEIARNVFSIADLDPLSLGREWMVYNYAVLQ